MRLTSRGRYAVTAILDIAIHGKKEPVSLADIADRQAISLSYLEQLFAQLRREGIVYSVRGPGGGYKLEKEPKAVNENVDVTKCKGSGNCRNDSRCLTHTLWERLEDQIGQFLNTVSLDDLVQENADHDCDKSHCHEH